MMMNRLLILVFDACVLCGPAAAQETIQIKFPDEIREHYLSGRNVIASASANSLNPLSNFVVLQIVVDREGSVVSAIPIEGPSQFYGPAVDLALKWRFAPFKKDGRPVRASFDWSVRIVPPEKKAKEHVGFPEVQDWNSLKVTLRRTGCFGWCPAYTLVVYGDGRVHYDGRSDAKPCGEWVALIPVDSVHEIVSYFRAADYFSVLPSYQRSDFGDGPTYTSSITFDGKHMSVEDHAGVEVGMPASVSDVENAIDRLAGPKSWAKQKQVQAYPESECLGPFKRHPAN